MCQQNVKKQQEIQGIIDELETCILKHTQQTVFKNREELTQEIKALMVEKATVMLDEEPMGFFEYIEKNVLKEEIII
ncbi:hypothetical protein C1N87_33295 (plasmid) [Priestia aryabhattai]